MSRLGVAFLVMGIVAAAAPAHAQVVAWCDADAALPALDGVIDPSEYSGSSTGVGSGFGGMIGAGALMHIDSDSMGNLAMALDATAGVCAWGADDTVVVYIDAIPSVGFADTTTFIDTGDPGRAAASGLGTDLSRAELTFAPGFTADHAIVLRGDSANLFRLRAGEAHLFLRSLSRAPSTGFAAACVREVAGFSMRDLGSQAGNPLRWMATLINTSNGFRSNELHGVAVAPASNIGAAPFALAAGDRSTFESHGPPVGLAGSFAWIDFGTFDASGFAPVPTCGQLSSESWAITGFSDGTLAFGGTQTTPATDFTRGVPTGASVSTGGIYAFNVAANDRALGVQPAGGDFVPGDFTVRFVNTSTATITEAVIAYRFLFRNDSGRASTLSFDWSLDGTTFTSEPALTFTTPLAPDPTPVGWTSTSHTTTLTGLTIAPGGTLFVRFSGADAGGTGGRDELALDDIVVAPTYLTCGNGAIDPGESCDDGAANGTTPCGCQTDCSFATSGVACGGGGLGDCDLPDTCDGSGACVDRLIVAGTECRAASGAACDAPEACDGVGHACPADAFAPAGTVCAPADPLAPCDADDVCDGASAACPTRVASAGTVCRTPSGTCDLGASCDGASTACPASTPATAGTICRTATSACDVVESCDGSALTCPTDVLAAAGTPCRASTGACDAAEVCTGTSATCPTDAAAPDGAPCGDSLACNGTETCMAGVCADAPDLDCDDGDLCTADSCADPGGSCGHAPIAGCCNLSADCDDGDSCTVDTCSGPGGTCSSSPITGCCVSDADCADSSACTTDSCDPTTDRCVFAPIAGCCTGAADCDDGNVCTADACDGSGTCGNTAIEGCCLSDADCDDGDACTSDACGTDNACANDAIASCCLSAADCDDGDACTIDRCDEATMRCAAEPMDCDDGDACTEDMCVAGSCESAPICEDGGVSEDAGTSPDAGSASDDAGGNVMLDAGADAGTGGTTAGCGCHAVSRSSAPSLPLVLGLALLWIVRRRRRSA